MALWVLTVSLVLLCLKFIGPVSVKAIKNYSDTIEYNYIGPGYHMIEGLPNGGLNEIQGELRPGQSHRVVKVIDCVFQADKATITRLLKQKERQLLEAVKMSNNTEPVRTIGAEIKTVLKQNGGYYDKIIQVFCTTGNPITASLDKDSPVIHRNWFIAANNIQGTWHLFVYPAMRPDQTCLGSTPVTTTTTAPAKAALSSAWHLTVPHLPMILMMMLALSVT